MPIRNPLALLFAVALFALAAPSCDDTGQSSECTTRDGCDDPSEICIGPNDSGSSCGIEFEDTCFAHDECGEDRRCHLMRVGCSDDGLATECGPPCEPGSTSGGFRCGADGGWTPIPCDEGYACGPFQRCNPDRAHAESIADRAHGCGAIGCSADNPCAEGYCVNGRCQSGPGQCQPPPQ